MKIDSKFPCIGVLTYDIPHRKTYDVLCMLKAKGYKNIHVYAHPLTYRKTYHPIVQHRPGVSIELNPEEICRNFDYVYNKINAYEEISLPEETIFLICGAGLLPDEFWKRYKVINSHPGYIPNCRGLDALKWAIKNREPIGVTAHLLGDEVDAGYIICRERININRNDTFHTVCEKVYEKEIVLMELAIKKILSGDNRFEYISGSGYEVSKRMPHKDEVKLYEWFDEYKREIFSEKD